MLEMERDLKECFAELKECQQQALVDWVRRCLAPGKATLTSYGLKHCAENDFGFYILNEQMKRAMELVDIAVEDKSKVKWTPKRLRYYGRPIPAGSFLAWLAKRINRNSFLGDFARKAINDKDFPEEGNYQTFCRYLQPRFSDNHSARNAFNRAWHAYQKEAHKEA